ncbi:MAG: hypothetical protein GVY36_19415 [Verrucomicrobia bacterium]|jgi:hypothetical protein|nr:hypothetical protein [Verrucomicrobiota bacterium]
MVQKQNKEETLAWLRENPQLLEKLEQMRQMELDESETDFDRIELEMLELVKSMGAGSLGRCVQAKESKAVDLAKERNTCRIHSKKN